MIPPASSGTGHHEKYALVGLTSLVSPAQSESLYLHTSSRLDALKQIFISQLPLPYLSPCLTEVHCDAVRTSKVGASLQLQRPNLGVFQSSDTSDYRQILDMEIVLVHS